MKKYITILVSLLTFGGAAHAGQWTRLLSCSSGVGSLVVERDSDNLDSMQIVITGRDAVNVIAYGIQGNSSVMPPTAALGSASSTPILVSPARNRMLLASTM